MELGKIQTAWVEALEKYPERKMKSSLGKKYDNGQITCCCLGQGLITLCEIQGEEPVFDVNGLLEDGKGNITTLRESYKKLGLRTTIGDFLFNGEPVKRNGNTCLMSMNDGYLGEERTWPEIAQFIRENPDLIFNKSV